MEPVLFSPADEHVEPDEGAVSAEIVATMASIIEQTSADTGRVLRSVHAKSHALLEGDLEVLANLPAELAQGLFAKAGRYRVIMRISTNPGDLLPDDVSVPRGLAIKILDVDGAQLDGNSDRSQDLLMVNGPAFGSTNAKGFSKTLKLLAKTTDKATRAKQVLSAALRGVETVVEALGGESGTVKALGGHPMTHPLGDSYYTQTPFRYGSYVAKLAVMPASPNLTALIKAPLDVRAKPDGLREAMIDFFKSSNAEWDLRVQLRTNPKTMPIEDASVIWPEEESPYQTVAKLRMPKQAAWSSAKSAAFDDAMAFNPWHGLEAHRPLGSINRARRPAYEMSAQKRAQVLGCPMHETTRTMTSPVSTASHQRSN